MPKKCQALKGNETTPVALFKQINLTSKFSTGAPDVGEATWSMIVGHQV